MEKINDATMEEFGKFINQEIRMANENNEPYAKDALESVKTSLSRFAYYKRTGTHPPIA